VTNAVPIAAPFVVDPRTAGAFGAAIICGLLLLQYAHRRQPFIMAWAAGWLLLVPAMLLVDRPYATAVIQRLAIGASQCLVICASALVFWSADLFRQTRYAARVPWKAAAAVVAWLLISPQFGAHAVLVPGYVLNAAVLAAAAAMYVAVLLERRMIGAGLIAFVLLGIAVSNVATAIFLPRMPGPNEAAFQIFVVNAVLSILGALGVHLLVFEEMTYELRVMNRRLEAAREELLQAAITDPLTGCHNRRFLEQVMDRELQRHTRFALPLSLLFIDIDRFKAINDTLGHEAGDRVLQYVARFLKRHIREADYVFRWGGDEFLVLITCVGEEARKKAAGLKVSFDAAPEAVELPPGIGLSVGSIEVPHGTTDLLPIIADADTLMYQDKGRRPAASAPAPAPTTRGRKRS
jgi:diguanylate cyclase (GGDEF)-like protein